MAGPDPEHIPAFPVAEHLALGRRIKNNRMQHRISIVRIRELHPSLSRRSGALFKERAVESGSVRSRPHFRTAGHFGTQTDNFATAAFADAVLVFGKAAQRGLDKIRG